MIIHEGGHMMMAMVFKRRIHFKFQFGMLFKFIPIPRGVWQMPNDISSIKQKAIAIAGFLSEFLMLLMLLSIPRCRIEFAPYYAIVSIAHIMLYKYYAGEASDFKWLTRKK